jgi:glycoside/pentoside/hexuronide:cation symporter, GPH family
MNRPSFNLATWIRGKAGAKTQTGISKFFLAFPIMPLSLSNVLIHNAYIKYYTDIIGLDVKLIGIVYLVFGIWNAINDPMLGVVIDRSRYRPRRGKYVFFMRVTAPLIAFSAFAMLFSQPSWDQWLIFLALLALLFVFDTAQTAFSISYANYILVAAPSKDERVDVSVISTYIANIGSFFGTIIPTLLLVGGTDRSLTVILFSGVLLLNSIMYWLALRNIRDKAEMYKDDAGGDGVGLSSYVRDGAKEALKSRSFVVYVLYQLLGRGPMIFYFTPFLYLMDHAFHFSGTMATLVDVIPGLALFIVVPFLGRFVKARGMKKAAIVWAFPMALGFLSLYFVQGFWQVLLGYCLIIVSAQVGVLIINPMLGAIIDEDEQKTGVRKAGLFTGLSALLTIPNSGIQAAIFTSLIGQYGFISGAAQQSARAIEGIRVGAGIVPFAFVLLSVIPMLFSPITLKRERELSLYSEARRGSGEEAAAEN